MYPQANSLHHGELPIERVGLKPACLLASGGQQQEDFHSTTPCLPNQFSSKQRRKAIRGRCSMTHRLFSVIFSMAQISLLSTSSSSRRLNTVLTFLGNLFEQSR